jgi:hypothetical protein
VMRGNKIQETSLVTVMKAIAIDFLITFERSFYQFIEKKNLQEGDINTYVFSCPGGKKVELFKVFHTTESDG